MKKLKYLLLFTLVYSACTDSPTDIGLKEKGIEMRINGRKLFIEQEGLVNYGKVNGEMSVNAEDFEGEGILFNLGSNFSSGFHNLEFSPVELVYQKNKNEKYTFVSGHLDISDYQETLLILKGDFEGVAVNNMDQLDSVEISGGLINLDFN
jgi:hypothetical protein